MLEPIAPSLPFWRLVEAHRGRPYPFLLDSARDPATLGAYSFLGAGPRAVFRAWRSPGRRTARVEVQTLRTPDGRPLEPPRVETFEGDPFAALARLRAAFAVPPERLAGRPAPFLGGGVGWFGYDAAHCLEILPDLARDDLGLPTIAFAFYDAVLVHDHRTGRTWLSAIGRGDDDASARRAAERLRDENLARLAAFEADPPPPWEGPTAGATPTRVEVVRQFDEEAYCRLVERAREHIFAGDVFEVCLTHRLESPFAGDPWNLYQELRRINPAPFAAYLEWPEAQIVSSSPERFVRLDADGQAESRPIKGTRPRGATPEEDDALFRDLASSAKDRAENVMIVDLVRNDFGRVCRFHSVHVPELTAVERYATVFQLVSTVRGALDDGRDGLDLVRACFPGGSMTGAPKIEAMKIIERLEPMKRGVYSGAIGYLDAAGPLDLSIVIRTIVVKDGRAYYNVGGAIVADSDPRDEHRETLVKARALIDALSNLQACPRPRP